MKTPSPGLIATGALLSLLSVGGAAASLLPGGYGQIWQDWVLENYPTPLEQVLEQVRQSSPRFEQILDGALGDSFKDLQRATGSNHPDPYRVRSGDAPVAAGILEANPIVQQRDLANLYDQEIARSLAAPLLGEAGTRYLQSSTERTTALMESSKADVQQVRQLAEAAQGLGVTQDVMKQNAQIQAKVAQLISEQSQLTADNHTVLLQLQQLQGMLAQLTADTSEGIDEANRRDRIERQISISGSAQAPLYLPGALGTVTPEGDPP